MQVGQKVKVVNLYEEKGQTKIAGVCDTLGMVGTLIEDEADYQPYRVEFPDGESWWYFEGELEEVEDEE